MMLAGIALSHAVVGLVMVLIFPVPPLAAWPLILASTVAHYLYYYLLLQMYQLGDLSQVYPIARGLAPMAVAVGAFMLIGENPGRIGWIALGLVSLGIVALGFGRRLPHVSPMAVPVAIATGVIIASYSVLDGMGVRLTPSPYSYMAYVFLSDLPVFLFILIQRNRFKDALESRGFRAGLVGGVGALTAYGMVMYAKSIAQLGPVSAVRESSVIIAALIGIIIFKERPWLRRVLSACVVGAGVLLLAISSQNAPP